MYARSRYSGGFGIGGATPLTLGIIIAAAGIYVLGLTSLRVDEWLMFFAPAFPAHFWTLLSWPLAISGEGSPLNVLFAVGWFYLFSGSLERAWGTRDLGAVLLGLSAVMAALCWGGFLVAHTTGVLFGLSALTGPLMVAWAIVNYREVLTFFFIPIPAPIVGWIGVAMTWYYGGTGLSGLCLVPACGLMYWYVTQGRYGDGGFTMPKASASRPFRDRANSGLRLEDFDRTPATQRRPAALDEIDRPRGLSLVRWWRDRQEKKRLEEIFRRSGFTDDDERR